MTRGGGGAIGVETTATGGVFCAKGAGCVGRLDAVSGVERGATAAVFGAIFLTIGCAGLVLATGSFEVEATGAAATIGADAGAATGALNAGSAPAATGAAKGAGPDRISTIATPKASVVAPKAPTAAHNQRLEVV